MTSRRTCVFGSKQSVVLALLGFAVSSLPHLSHAGSSTSRQDAAAAEALFTAARRELSAGELESACAKFQESLELDRTVGTLLNLASCESRRGRLASSWSLWREALELLPRGDDRLAFAQEQAALLEPRLPHLSLKFGSEITEEYKVSLDGVELGPAALTLAIPVDPGAHTIQVEATGHESRTYAVKATEGSSQTLTLALGNKKKTLPAAHAPATRVVNQESRSTLLPWATISLGAVGLGTGVITSFMINNRRSTLARECDLSTKVCSSAGFHAAEQGKALLPINAVGFGVGALGLSGGIYWLLSGATHEKPLADVAVTLTTDEVRVGYGKKF